MNFEEIYRLYFEDVYLFILAMSSDPDIAEEVTQETFFKALKNLNKFKGESSVKTWLCQIGKNTYLSHLKKRKHLTGKEESGQSCRVREADQEDSAEMICVRRDEAMSIYKILHHLDEPYKEVFTLRTPGDLTFSEIGEIFGRKEGWARVTYHRARLKIREFIKKVSE